MANTDKKAWEKSFKLTTPVGEVRWSSLWKAQDSKDPKYGPKYNLTLEFTEADAAAFEKQINDEAVKAYNLLKKEKPKAIHAPFSIDADAKGRFTIYPSKDATFKNGDASPPPPVYDAQLKPITEHVMIGNGTRAAASVEVRTKFADGVFKVTKPSLRAVQIVELVEYVGTGGGSKQVDASGDFEATKGYTFAATPVQENADDGDQSF